MISEIPNLKRKILLSSIGTVLIAADMYRGFSPSSDHDKYGTPLQAQYKIETTSNPLQENHIVLSSNISTSEVESTLLESTPNSENQPCSYEIPLLPKIPCKVQKILELASSNEASAGLTKLL